jgi:hypothetical protein
MPFDPNSEKKAVKNFKRLAAKAKNGNTLRKSIR